MPPTADFSWKNFKILIADDEPDMREIFSAWFRNLGCAVSEAADGLAAVELFAQDRFDVVVTDVRMPRLDGIQLIRELRGSSSYTPVIIFVSGFMDLSLADALDLGVESVLSKPCDRRELIMAVQRSLLRRNFVFEQPVPLSPLLPQDCLREDFPHGIAQSHVALGRGGFSLNSEQRKFVNSSVGFAFTFSEGPILSLRGWGQLRWCENLRQGSRIGVEFLHLEPDCRDAFERWMAEHHPFSFIPKNSQRPAVLSFSP
jgi:CheY-like chemotaxis protein